MSLAAVASFNYVASKLGVTGFQASCADLDIIRRTRNIEVFSIQDYGKLLYPQNLYHFDNTLRQDTFKWLQEKAQELIDNASEHTHPNVMAHWKSIVAGELPGDFRIRED